jgi:hypothetical protein
VTVHKATRSQESGEPAAKIAKLHPVKETRKQTATFVPLQDVLEVDWSSETYAKRLPKTDPSYFLMRGNVRSCKQVVPEGIYMTFIWNVHLLSVS